MGLKTTVTFDDPLDFTYDVAKMDVSLGRVTLLPTVEVCEVAYYNFNVDDETEAVRGASNISYPGAGADPIIANGKMDIVDFVNDESYANLSGCFNGSTEYAFQFKWTPHYSTVSTSRALLNAYNTDGSTDAQIRLHISNQGGGVSRLWVMIADSAGAILINDIIIITLVAEHEYDLAFSYDEITGELRFFVDGVLEVNETIAVPSPLNLSNTTLLTLGHAISVALYSANCSFDDFQMCDTNKFTGEAGPLTYPTPEIFTYDTTEHLIYLNSTVNMSTPLGFSDIHTIDEGNSIIGHYFQVDGVKYWFNGVHWDISDGAMDQSNTAAEIEAAKDLFPTIDGGAAVRLNMLLASLDGYTAPSISQVDMEYSLYLIPSDTPTCLVYGVVKDNSGLPVAGAKITFNTPDFFYNENLIAPSVTVYSDDRGTFIAALVETTTDNVEASCVIEYKQGKKVIKNTYTGLIIPNTAQASLASLI